MAGSVEPNTFIVGAAKCGTTAMHGWLAQHPEAFMAKNKEPGFFAPDLPWKPAEGIAVFDRDEYLALFAGSEGARVRGESSVVYLRSAEAAGRIHDANPDARIIVMLRHPVVVMESLHSFLLYLGLQPERDFATALKAGPPPGQEERWLLDYRGVVDFAPQFERYQRTFRSDQVHVIVHDDLQRDPDAVWKGLCAFLGIDTDARIDFRRLNPNREARLGFVQERFLQNLPGPLATARRVLPAGSMRRLRRQLVRLNTREVQRTPIDPDLRAELVEEMRPDIQRLAAMIDRDLTHWLV